jgi:hypothetical protein
MTTESAEEPPEPVAGVATTGGWASLDPDRLSVGRVRRLAVLFGLCGFAVVLPLLGLLGDNPSLFDDRGFREFSILLFALAVVLVPALVLWVTGEVVSAASATAGRWFHTLSVGFLLAAVGFLLLKAIGLTAPVVAWPLGIIFGAAALAAYLRSEFVRTWLSFLVVVPLAVGVSFLGSPAGETATQEPLEPAELNFEEPPPSVVFLVVDELPTRSIMTEAGSGPEPEINAERFPNLANFADTSTWYRRATTVSPFTRTAVPTIAAGTLPAGEPLWTDHPQNVFSLLAGSHHLTVSESLTRLCGFTVCAGSPLAAPERGAVPPPPDLPVADWADMAGEAVRLWGLRVLPNSGSSDELNDFEEERNEVPDTSEAPAPNVEDDLDMDAEQLRRFFAIQPDAQPKRHVEFLDAIGPASDPVLYFMHWVLPHSPFTYRPDGTVYTAEEELGAEPDTQWQAEVYTARHLMQAEYSDALLGQVLAKLEATDNFDNSLIIITADHGLVSRPNTDRRVAQEATLEDIVFVPMLVKVPGQTEGAVDDSNATIMDLFPTVVDVLDVAPGWDLDGTSLLADRTDRGRSSFIFDYFNAFTTTSRGVIDYDIDELWDRSLGRSPAPLGGTAEDPVDRTLGLYLDLPADDPVRQLALNDADWSIGAEVPAQTAELTATAVVPELARLTESDGAPMPGVVAGLLDDGAEGTAVVSLNDQVVALAPVEQAPGDADGLGFLALLPTLDAEPGTQRSVRVHLVDADGTAQELQVSGQ